MPMATSPLPWFAHPRGLYQMTAPEELSKHTDKMAMTSVLPHPMSNVSPPTSQACMPVRFLKMERQESEEHHHPHYSPVLRLPTPEEQRDAKRAPNNTPPTTTNEEDSVPLDFSSRSAPCAQARTMTPPEAPNCGGDEVVDLCTRGTLDERYRHHAAEEEERHNTSRGSSTDSSSVFNVSSEVPYPYATHHRQQHQAGNPPSMVQQQYPIQPVALHPHQHHQHFMMAASAAPRHQTSPHMGATEGSAAPSPPIGHQNFPGILSLTPPPPVPLHAPLQASVPHPLSPPQQPPFPPLLPAPLHQTLAAAASSGKADSGTKVTRPFKAYPKDPLTLTVGVSTAESLLGQASNEAYVEFRKQMLRQVAATKARRPVQSAQGAGEEEASPSNASAQESPEFQQQNQSSASSGDEEGSSGGSGKKRVRTNSESNGPYSVVKDAAYWERRRKNNEAAKRSRDARRAKEDEIAIRAAFLEQENLKLKYEVAALRHETSNLRCLLYSAASSS